MTEPPPRDPWFSADTRAGVVADVRAIEARSRAEVVVTVRAAADPYRDVDLLAGLVPALVVLLGYLYLPITFTDDLIGPAIVLAFTLGMFAARLPAVRRACLARRRTAAAARTAARAAFVDLGVSDTRARTGLLVFVALLERRVEVVLDLGIARAPLPPSWPAALAALERSLARGPDVRTFRSALAALAEPLADALPRQPGDRNELPDEVSA